MFPSNRREDSGATSSRLRGRYHQQWAIVVAPRLLSHLVQEGDFPLGRQVWQDTELIMPDGAPLECRNAITKRSAFRWQCPACRRRTTQFSRGVTHGRRKGAVCSNRLSREGPTSIPPAWWRTAESQHVAILQY